MASASSPSKREHNGTGKAARHGESKGPGANGCLDPLESAEAAGLQYVTDAEPGIRRLRSGKGFRYVGPDDTPVRDAKNLRRIKRLVIPPAWTDVWICAIPTGHVQVTGRDDAGRKQYRYHPAWREARDETKYGRMVAFGQALPVIRQRVSDDLARRDLSREKVLATIVRLLERTLVRVGNEEYARANRSFGLTTLRDRHAEVNGSALHLHFRGKSGKEHIVDLRDRRVASVVKRCRDLPGQHLFQYVDEAGERHAIGSADVNAYLREVAGDEFTAKDFRTWSGSLLACQALLIAEPAATKTEAERQIVHAVDEVACQLGNTRAVCRRCYIHPAVLDAYLDGSLATAFPGLDDQQPDADADTPDLSVCEQALLHFLERLDPPRNGASST